MFEKIRKSLGLYLFFVIILYQNIIKISNPSFLQANKISANLYGYGFLYSLASLLLVSIIILIGYHINIVKKKLFDRYIYIYILNIILFFGLFLWKGIFTLGDLYNTLFPVTRNSYPLLVGIFLSLLIKNEYQKLNDDIKKNITIAILIIYLGSSLFNKDIFGLGNGNSVINGMLLTMIGYNLKDILKYLSDKKILLFTAVFSIISAFLMINVSLDLHGDLSTAFRLSSINSINIVILAIYLANYLKEKLTINDTKLNYIFVGVLLISNEYIIRKSIENIAVGRLLYALVFSLFILVIQFILGYAINFLSKKNIEFEIPRINKYELINIGYLLFLSWISIILAAPDGKWPHLTNESKSIFMFATFNNTQALIINTLIYYLIFKLIYIVTNKYWVSCIFNWILVTIWVIANKVKINYRLEPILPADFKLISEYKSIIGMVPMWIILVASLISVFLVILSFYLEKTKKVKSNNLNWLSKVLWIIAICLFFSSSLRMNHEESYVNKFLKSMSIGDAFENQLLGAQDNSFGLRFLKNIDTISMSMPNEYSKRNMENIYKKYKNDAQTINLKRNNKLNQQTVIFNLSESLSNPNRVNGVKLKNNPIPYIDNVIRKHTGGVMISSGYGGGTANLEYMALTGFPVSSFKPVIASPYTQIVGKQKNSYSINNLFNESEAIHPFTGTFYSRKAVYNKFGFEKFYFNGSKYKITNKKYIGKNPYLSDETSYSNVLKVINSSKNGKFINLVTMQNHLPYSDYYGNTSEYQLINPKFDEIEQKSIQDYSKGISYTDQDVKKFINEIDKIKKPITIVLYGDHLPGIYGHMSTNTLNAHETDYFIYSNKYARNHGAKNLDKKDTKYVSPIEFSPMVAKQTNSKVTPYLALLTKIQEELPAIDVYAFNDGKTPKFVNDQGKEISYKKLTKRQKELYNDLKLVQYDMTTGKQYLSNTKFYK